MRNEAAVLTLMISALLLPVTLNADGGVVRLREVSGPFLITVYTASETLHAGLVDTSVLVQDRNTGEVIQDAMVFFAAQPADSETRIVKIRATHEQATNKLLQAATLDMSVPGPWRLNIYVLRGQETADFAAVIQVEPATPRLAAIWPYLLLPPISIVIFVLHQKLRREALQRGSVEGHFQSRPNFT